MRRRAHGVLAETDANARFWSGVDPERPWTARWGLISDAASATLVTLAHVARLEVDASGRGTRPGTPDDAALLALVAGLQGPEALLWRAGWPAPARRTSANDLHEVIPLTLAVDQITSEREWSTIRMNFLSQLTAHGRRYAAAAHCAVDDDGRPRRNEWNRQRRVSLRANDHCLDDFALLTLPPGMASFICGDDRVADTRAVAPTRATENTDGQTPWPLLGRRPSVATPVDHFLLTPVVVPVPLPVVLVEPLPADFGLWSPA